ncbi:adenylate kinase [Actinoplanes solisilvae]|uniref:adenylate kinase n=1 Tax=Actinoplanes solisilvae TaxID=2486853 RepID=UPI000FDAE9E7|nr:adenylate kinase [Actinoplanes solisilvae]
MGVILLGAPGAGKGTQAAALAGRVGAVHISTGDIFRTHVSRGTDLGRTAQRYLDAGQYVPDDVTNAMVREQIRDDAFVLDGFPRTVRQVAYLDELLDGLGLSPVRVVVLTVPPQELITRLVRRAHDSGRSDDIEEIIRERQAVYRAETTPLLGIYRERGLLREVDGAGRPDEVARRIDAALAAISVTALRPDASAA